jgi:P27 family predicted phage terminase small subunit
MGKRGPAPEPNALRLAKGTYRPDKHGDPSKELKPAIIPLPRPPKELGKKGKEAWKRLGESLIKLNLLSENDYETFRMLCETFDFESKLNEQVAKDGMVVLNSRGTHIVHPCVKMARECLRDRNRLMRLFGMNPSDRSSAVTSTKDAPVVSESRIAARKRG